MINKTNIIKCKNCKYPIAVNKSENTEENDIFVNNEEIIAIKTMINSLIARCSICEQLLGVKSSTNDKVMLFREKIKLKTMKCENKVSK